MDEQRRDKAYQKLVEELLKNPSNSGKQLEVVERAKLEIYPYEESPEKWAEIKIDLGDALTNQNWGDRKGNLEQAIMSYTDALQVFTREKFPEKWADIQNKLGFVYINRIRGDIAENQELAITAFNKALQVYTHEKFPEKWADIQNKLGLAYINRIRGGIAENQELAIVAFNKALQVYTYEKFPEKWTDTQNQLGLAYSNRVRGDIAENQELAITAFNKVLQVYTRNDFPDKWADTQHNLGIAYNKLEKITEAINAFKNALQVRTPETFPDRAFPDEWKNTEEDLRTIYCSSGKNLQKAKAAYKRALKVYNREALPEKWAITQNHLGVAYSKQGQIDEAIKCFQLSLTISTPTAFPIYCLEAGRNLGNTALAFQQWVEAIKGYHLAIEAVEQSRTWAITDARRQEILSDAIAVYANMVQACINNNQSDKAIEYVERSKARNLVELLATRDIYPRGNIPETVLNELKQLRQEIVAEQRSLDIAEQNRSGGIIFDTGEAMGWDSAAWLKDRERLNQLLQQLDNLITNEIDPVDPSFRATQQVEPISYREIQTLVGDRAAIVEWYITNENFHTFIITHQSQHPLVWSSSAEERQALMEWQDEYLQDYQQNREQWIEKLSERLQRLSQILHIDEILNSLPANCDQLILIPHRFLHLIPLHALPLSEQSCLLDRFPRGVRYAPSCQLLQLTQNQEWSNFNRFLAIQNPTKDLGYTTVEVEIIQHCFPHADVFVEDAAKKGAILEVKIKDDGTREVIQNPQLSLANCTHFSCHGEFSFEFPLDSALLLADGERLTLGEIFDLDLSQCRLVTLSACETGLTNYKILSDEYIGIPSSFLYAGSPSVVSSLWTVQDLSTAFLMINFYQNLCLDSSLLLTKSTVGIALNQAQFWLRNISKKELEAWIAENQISLNPTLNMDLRRRLHKMSDDDKPFQSPFYWAAFCAMGQ